MSEQTMRRKLSDEGMSYQRLKDELRYSLANTLLSKRGLPISEISTRLAFSEPRAFSRAYKQWSGITPKEFRLSKRTS
jgi:AraC-like DNA-binding protein